MVAEFMRLDPDGEFSVYAGIVASCNEDFIDLLRGSAIREQTGALAVVHWQLPGKVPTRAVDLTSVPFSGFAASPTPPTMTHRATSKRISNKR